VEEEDLHKVIWLTQFVGDHGVHDIGAALMRLRRKTPALCLPLLISWAPLRRLPQVTISQKRRQLGRLANEIKKRFFFTSNCSETVRCQFIDEMDAFLTCQVVSSRPLPPIA
jgi:hypothetical protein